MDIPIKVLITNCNGWKINRRVINYLDVDIFLIVKVFNGSFHDKKEEKSGYSTDDKYPANPATKTRKLKTISDCSLKI